MFTGIIECKGKIISTETRGANRTFTIESAISAGLQVDQSLCHNGVCLTVENVAGNMHQVTAIKETLDKTNLNACMPDDVINLERSMRMNGRLDGHIVQGHVDCTAVCLEKKEMQGSWEYTFGYADEFAPLLIEKGSVCVDGVSLTAFNVLNDRFTVAIIPYTYTHTNFSTKDKGSTVNIEFDILGKYVQRMAHLSAMK